VLPLALMLEWLAHGALHQNPGLHFHGCNELRLLHGVILDQDTPPQLRVGAGKAVKHEGFFLAPVELSSTGPDGRAVLHARAEMVLASTLPASPPPLPSTAVAPYPYTPEEFYREFLFHGPDLQGIERVEGCGERGIVATVRPAPSPSAWIRQPLRQKWLADPLVVDAALQLLILWSCERYQAGGLPCLIGQYRQYRRALPASPLHLVVQVRRHSSLQVLADVDVLDGDGTVLARLEGCESTIDPHLRRAFRSNRRAVPSLTRAGQP
jgi:hypothetical protein